MVSFCHRKRGNIMNTVKKERVTTRISKPAKTTLETAANIMGATLNQFLVQAALEKAENIIQKDKLITLSQKDTKVFFDSLTRPPEPNAKLKNAFKNYNIKVN